MNSERSAAVVNIPLGEGARASFSRRSVILLSAFSLFLLLGGCTGGSGPSTLNLTAKDANKTFQLHPGDQVVIVLDANPSTGFDWDIDQTNSAVLTLQGKTFQASSSGLPGSGGSDTFTFKALSTGTVNLRLKYWRSFAGPASITNRYAVTLQVLAAGGGY
ncbi:MAG TPA: protease inhibitor I42 family protein [Ktedonobacterales bacterium]|nr:protease inhibitor I42 family protein [Ktedonobacterales bacterium]